MDASKTFPNELAPRWQAYAIGRNFGPDRSAGERSLNSAWPLSLFKRIAHEFSGDPAEHREVKKLPSDREIPLVGVALAAARGIRRAFRNSAIKVTIAQR
jgi:hypothetical protein